VQATPEVISKLDDPKALFMVFAPTNEAWDRAAVGLGLTVDRLKANKGLLDAVVDYHIVPQRALNTSQWSPNLALPTLAPGQLIQVMHSKHIRAFMTSYHAHVSYRNLSLAHQPPLLSQKQREPRMLRHNCSSQTEHMYLYIRI